MLLDPAHPNAYFQDFENGLVTHPSKLRAFQELERLLGMLDDAAWGDLKPRASERLVSQAREQGRGWQSLFDVLNEANGYAFLCSLGCTGIKFIPSDESKTPDLKAVLDGIEVFCEVKTINISAEEAGYRKASAAGEIVVHETPVHMTEPFLQKLRGTIECAIAQIDAVDPKRKARRIVVIVVNFDDWVGDCQPQYFADLDDFLQQNPINGAELVFSPASNLFERIFTMRSATVFQLDRWRRAACATVSA